MLPVLQRLENIKWLLLFQWNLWQKSKVETVSAFRFFRFFNFSMFSTSRFFFLICRDFRLFEQKSIGLQALRFFFSSFRLFAAERYAFHGVTVTSQKGTQRLSGLCSKGIKITVTALEGWLGLRESSPNYRKFQVSEIYCNTQIRLVTPFSSIWVWFSHRGFFSEWTSQIWEFPQVCQFFFCISLCDLVFLHTHLQMCT